MATKSTKKATTQSATAGNLAHNLELISSPAPNKATITALLNSGVKMKNVTFCAVPVDMLEVEPIYQRIQCDFVQAIANNWDYAICGSIKVNHRNGRLYVKDGQNRVAAARLAGEETIMCAITEGEDVDREIDAFVHQNRYVTKISPYDVFYARRHKSTDSVAHQLQALFDKYNISYESANAGKKVGNRYISRSPANNAPGRMNCLYMVMNEADCGHLDTLADVFETIKQLDWHTMKFTYGKMFMSAMIYVHRNYGAAKVRARFGSALKYQTPESIINRARVAYDKLGVTSALTAYINDIMEGI